MYRKISNRISRKSAKENVTNIKTTIPTSREEEKSLKRLWKIKWKRKQGTSFSLGGCVGLWTWKHDWKSPSGLWSLISSQSRLTTVVSLEGKAPVFTKPSKPHRSLFTHFMSRLNRCPFLPSVPTLSCGLYSSCHSLITFLSSLSLFPPSNPACPLLF